MVQPKGTGKRPAFHQNTYAFKHNKGSKKTQKILRTPNKGLCQKCHDVIEWKKQYRKYKPLTQPRRCNMCQQKTITLAYHVICDPCALAKKICAKCLTPDEDGRVGLELKKIDDKKEIEKLAEQLAVLPLRKQKKILRDIEETEYQQRKERRRLRGETSDDEEEGEEEEEDDNDDTVEEEEQEKEIEYEEVEIEEVDEDESLMEGKLVMKKVIVRRPKNATADVKSDRKEEQEDDNSEDYDEEEDDDDEEDDE